MGRAWGAGVASIALLAASAFASGAPAGALPPAATRASSVPTGATSNQLNAVSCRKSTSCFAVGQSALTTLIEGWNGTAWSIASAPNLLGTLSAVSCPSTSKCFAVGTQSVAGANKELVEQWNGATWGIMASPNISNASGVELRGLSCTSTTFCIAVGSQFVAGPVASKPLVLRWNGKSWSLMAGSNLTSMRSFRLYGASCTSPTNCFAVGSARTAAGNLQTFVERWNGTAWSFVASPTPNLGSGGELLGVSCAKASSCFAIGDNQFANASEPVALAEAWDGQHWSAVNPVGFNRTYSRLASVSCLSRTYCIAAGYYQYANRPSTVPPTTLVERWNGKGWSRARSPNPGATDAELAGVSCTSTTSCVAVGRYTNSLFERSPSKLQTLVQQLHGTTWATIASPNAVNAGFAVLSDVSCTSATNCIAVGNSLSAGRNKTLIERWDGTAWSALAGANPTGATISQLAGVSCPSPSSCIAVGRFTTATGAGAAEGGPFKTLVEQWDGATWSIVASPNPASLSLARLDHVSCASTTSCMAIGVASASRDASDQSLAERWNGTIWSIVKAAPLSVARSGASVGLSGISCASATSCMAVYGYSNTGFDRQFGNALIEHWNGSTWSSVPLAGNEMAVELALSGVSCTSASDCVVTGTVIRAFGIGEALSLTLVEHWDGKRFSLVTSSGPPSGSYPRLDSVSCTTSTSCLAVGAYSTSVYGFDPANTLTEQWDGAGWSTVSSPNPADAASSHLASVSCATATSCAAVGSYQVGSTAATQPLIEMWNGTSWTIATSPVTG